MDDGVRYSSLAWRVYEAGSRVWSRSRLSAIRLAGLPTPPEAPVGTPLLVVANHVSWWDGFLVREIHRRLRPGEPFLTVMLEEELVRHPFLRRLGGIGFVPGSTASLRRLLRTLEGVRDDTPGAFVLLFPQGRLWPSHRRPLGFFPGVRAVRRALGQAAVLPMGIHLAPGKNPGQEAWISMGPMVPAGDADGSDVSGLEHRVEVELDAVLAFLSTHGEGAGAAWPSLHASLPRSPRDGDHLMGPAAGSGGTRVGVIPSSSWTQHVT